MTTTARATSSTTGELPTHRESFIELNGRERAISFFDKDSWRELVGPFDRIESPWLMPQNVTPESDDGCIVIKGKVDGISTVVIALEPAFQGGSLGEVSGAKNVRRTRPRLQR